MAISASITSLGVGTGIDTESLVTKLLSLESQPLAALATRETSYNAQISAFGSIKAKLSTLQDAAAKLADPNQLAAFAPTVGDEDVIGASAGSFARAGSYSIEVTQLAKAQKSFSSLYASGDTFGAGTLSFTIGGTTSDVTLTAGGNSLNDVANAINDAGIGVSATVVNGDAGSRLVLTSKDTGTDAAFSLSVSGGDANLTSLASFDVTNPNAVAAQNAIATIEGETVTSQSNQITSAINNVTITAKAIGTSTLDIARDDGGITEAAKAFVDAYNSLYSDIKAKSAYDSTTKTAQPLNGDATTRTIANQLRAAMGQVPSSLAGDSYEYLSALGISFQQDGTLTLDTAKLDTAVSSDFAGTLRTLGAYGGAIESLSDAFLDPEGIIENKLEGIGSSLSRIADSRERLNTQLDLTEQRLRAQFSALDVLVGTLNTTSSYLSQQLTSLQNLNNNN